MKTKLSRNTLLVFLVIWTILAAVLVFVIEIPFSLALVIKLIIACAMIAMSYYYVASRSR